MINRGLSPIIRAIIRVPYYSIILAKLHTLSRGAGSPRSQYELGVSSAVKCSQRRAYYWCSDGNARRTEVEFL